jgi:molecular chaperone DnaK
VLKAVEQAKRHLSEHPYARIEEEFIAEKDGQPLHLSMEIGRDEFEDMIGPLLERTIECVRRAMADANLTATQIDKVVLVGGSTRIPAISRLLEEQMRQPAHAEVNPDLCVALGAAIQAGIIAGQSVGAVLVDITPHSLGIKCLDDSRGMPFDFRFARIIPRNSALPASRSDVFYTFRDRQTEVEIDVYQGESDDVRRNHRVGRFLVQGLGAVPAGNPIIVQFDLTLDGILQVTARERATGLQKQVTIDNALARFERDEREGARERLERLWLPDEQVVGEPGFASDEDLDEEDELIGPEEAPTLAPGPREGQREAVQARALLEKADRLLERVSPEDRSEVERLMEKVRTALTDRHWDQLTAASNELADTLFYLEDA